MKEMLAGVVAAFLSLFGAHQVLPDQVLVASAAAASVFEQPIATSAPGAIATSSDPSAIVPAPPDLSSYVTKAELDSALDQRLAPLSALVPALQRFIAGFPTTQTITSPVFVPSYLGVSAPLTVGGWAASQRIDQLSGTSLSNVTVNGVSGLTDADIPDGVTASNYLPLMGGTLTGNLVLDASSTLSVAGQISAPSVTASDLFSTSTVRGMLSLTKVDFNSVTSVPPATFSAATGPSGVLSGSYYYSITYVTDQGETSGSFSVGPVTPSSQQVVISNIPVSTDSRVNARKIYRTVANDAEPNNEHFVATINDNVATSYVDNLPDVSLGSTVPSINTTGGIITVNGESLVKLSKFSLAIGYRAFDSNTGYANTAIGAWALPVNTSGVRNVAVGIDALYSNTTGSRNNAFGVHALNDNTAGYNNTALGYGASFKNTTGFDNTVVGASAGYSGTTVNNMTAVGSLACNSNNAGGTTCIGSSAGKANTTGAFTTAVGNGALMTNVSGNFNTAIGTNALNLSTANDNTAVGALSLTANTTGWENSAVGKMSLYNNAAGYSNSAFGVNALHTNTSGYENSAFGNHALRDITTGNGNAAYGYGSLRYAKTSSLTTAIGYRAGAGEVNGSDTNTQTDLYMTFLGAHASRAASIASTTPLVKGTAIGYNAQVGGSNMMALGGTGADAVKVGVGTTTPWRYLSVVGTVGFDGLTGATGAGSLCLTANREVVYNSGSDNCLSSLRSTKHDINPIAVDALAQVLALQPVSFIYNDDASSTVRYGFIADDAVAVDPHLGTYDAGGNVSGVDDRSILSIVVKAIQTLAAKVTGFADAFTTRELTYTRATGDQLTTKELTTDRLCVGAVCVTSDQFLRMVEQAGQTPSAVTPEPTPEEQALQDQAATTSPTLNESFETLPNVSTDDPASDENMSPIDRSDASDFNAI